MVDKCLILFGVVTPATKLKEELCFSRMLGQYEPPDKIHCSLASTFGNSVGQMNNIVSKVYYHILVHLLQLGH